MKRPLSLCFIACLAAVAGACSAPPNPAPSFGDRNSCLPETRSTSTLRLVDGRTVYIEPMASAQSGRTILLAGEPVYAWKFPDGSPELDTTHRLLGVRITSGRVEPFPKPDLPGVVTHVRLLADGADFAAIFAVTDSSSVGAYDERVLSYWFGRTDGRTWHSLERLPLPPRPLNARSASRLTRNGNELLLAAPFGADRDQNIAVFVRRSEGWRLDTLALDLATEASLTTMNGESLLYVLHGDPVPGGSNALSLFARSGSGWRSRGMLLRGGDRSLYNMDVVETGQAFFFSWADGGFGFGSHIPRAYAARVQARGVISLPVRLLTGVDPFLPVKAVAGDSSWVVSSPNRGSELLTLLGWDDSAAVIRDVVVSPFRGSAFALRYDGSTVAIGPVFNPASNEGGLVSGILRFTLRCRSAVPRETP